MSPLTDAQIEAFLDEALPPQRMAAVEEAIRRDESVAARVAQAVGRRDAGLHSLGAVWRRRRLTCPTREQLGSYLLGVLSGQQAEYVDFHLETIGCRICTASVADLQARHAAEDRQSESRRKRYFQSSAGYLSRSQRRS